MPAAPGTWLLTCPRTAPDGPGAPGPSAEADGTAVVAVTYQGTDGPDGRPLYRSEDGRVSAEIAPGGLVHHLTLRDGTTLTLAAAHGLVYLAAPDGRPCPGTPAHAEPSEERAGTGTWRPGPPF